MLDVEPSADTGKKDGGTRSGGLTASWWTSVAHRLLVPAPRLTLCGVMRTCCAQAYWHIVQAQKQQRHSGSGSGQAQMPRTAQTTRLGRHQAPSGQRWQTASAQCWQTLTTMT
jgi:hypothetical protein